MNIDVCFFFLSFYHHKIRDPEFYEFHTDVKRGLTFAKHESGVVTDKVVYSLINKTYVENKYFSMGYILGLCLRLSDASIESVYKMLLKEHGVKIKYHIFMHNMIADITEVKTKINIHKSNYDVGVELSRYTDVNRYMYKVTVANYQDICDRVDEIIDSGYGNLDRTKRSLLIYALSLVESAKFKSERMPIMHYYNTISMVHFINSKYIKLLDLLYIICRLTPNHLDISENTINTMKYTSYMYMLQEYNVTRKIDGLIKNIEYEYFMFNEIEKQFFITLISNSNVDTRIYERIINAIQYKDTFGKSANVEPPTTVAIVDEQNKGVEVMGDTDMNTGIFAIGVQTIDRMQTITMEISNEDAAKMTNVICALKNSVDKYKKYSNVGWWSKLFTSNLEIQANMAIAVLDFENLLKKGSTLSPKLLGEYESFSKLHDDLRALHDDFNADIAKIDEYLADDQYSYADKQRLQRRRNDLLAAQTLSDTTAMQYNLAKNNIGILVDKFVSIEKILKPAIEMNMNLDDSKFNLMAKYF